MLISKWKGGRPKRHQRDALKPDMQIVGVTYDVRETSGEDSIA